MTSPMTVGQRMRTLRLAAAMSQSDLANALPDRHRPGNKIVSQIENGRHPIDDDIVAAFASVLSCTPGYLTSSGPDVVSTKPWLRAYADANAKHVDSILADDIVANEAIHTLQLKRIPDQMPLFEGDLNDNDAIEDFAENVRAAADISSGAVVGNAMRAADRLGCVVLPLADELGRHLGMSHRVDGVPFIRVSRPDAWGMSPSGDRQRFTVAHEIGHLGLHAHMSPPDSAATGRRIEMQAHRFAAAFLAPAQPLIEDWEQLGRRVTLNTLAELKATWGIAIKALIVRFEQLGIVDADHATSLYKQSSKRGWNKAEPVATTSEQPIWLHRALVRWAQSEPDSADPAVTAAHRIGLDPSLVARWTDWSPRSSQAAAPVVSLYDRARKQPRPAPDKTPGDVVSLTATGRPE